MTQENNYLLLKWGVPKAWKISNKEHLAILQRYFDLGSSMSCMAQPNTDEHKKVLCELIDVFEGTIANDWSGEEYTKEQAKKYVTEYK